MWDVLWDQSCCEAEITGHSSAMSTVTGTLALGPGSCSVELTGRLTVGAELSSQEGASCGCASGQTTADLWARWSATGSGTCALKLGGNSTSVEASVSASSEIGQDEEQGCSESSSSTARSDVEITLRPSQAGWLRIGPAIVHQRSEGGSNAN